MKRCPIACVVVATVMSAAQVTTSGGSAGQIRGLSASDAQVQAGLRAVLSLSCINALQKVGAENGFWSSYNIKIGLPGKLSDSEKGLRRMGQGLTIDDLELSMNRVAEAVAPSIGPLVAKAIAAKTFSDARSVLNGGPNSATEEFRQAYYPALVSALRSTVAAAASRTTAQQQLQALATQYTGLTMGETCKVNLVDYITQKMLDGLFTVTGQEEASIRSNPQGQSELIKTVFSLPL